MCVCLFLCVRMRVGVSMYACVCVCMHRSTSAGLQKMLVAELVKLPDSV